MKKFLFFFVFLFILILSSCENPLFVEASGLYTVSFETNGGTEIQAFRTDKITSSPKTQKEGYIFAGWYTSSNYLEEVSFPFELSRNITFYARWEERLQSYSVTFITNGGTSIEPFSGLVIQETPFTSKNGFTFKGWYLDKQFQNPVSFPYYPKQDCIFHAKWTERSDITYIVKHYKQETDLKSYKLYESEELSGTYGALTQAKSKYYSGFHDNEFEQKIINANGTTEIEIYYDLDQITVIFDANDGSGNTDSQTFFFGVSQKLKANHFTRENYFFDGWIENQTNASFQYSEGTYMTLVYPHGTVITLHAKWVYGITVTNNAISNMDLSSLTDNCIIKVTGVINQNTLVNLAEKIETANKFITLDLSGTNGLESISRASNGTSLFKNCKKLESIILPEGLTTIGSYAFSNCSSLTYVIIPKTVKTIGTSAFSYSGIKEVTLNGTVTIGECAFYSCKSLYKVTMSGVTTISESAFCGCSGLTNITIDAQNIILNAFGSCTNLTSVTFSKALKKISYIAFCYCDNLSSATFLDTNNWYFGSTKIDVTNPATNATNLKNDYKYSDWIKK